MVVNQYRQYSFRKNDGISKEYPDGMICADRSE